MKTAHWAAVLSVLLLLPALTLAQFVDVTAEISVDRMPEKERNDLKTLEQMLPAYFENYEWFDNNYNIQMAIKINMFPQSVNSSGFERVFTAQMFISNESGDQRFFEKGFQFVYNQNDPLLHSTMPHSLTSALDFYAYMFLAGEMDTYEPLGGNSLYEKARDVATQASVSPRPQGWKSRIQELEEIMRLRDHRMAKYHFWAIIDLLDQGKTKQARAEVAKFIQAIDNMFQINARERHTHVFLDVHARDIAGILRDFGTSKQRARIIALDPDNEKIYKQIFNPQ